MEGEREGREAAERAADPMAEEGKAAVEGGGVARAVEETAAVGKEAEGPVGTEEGEGEVGEASPRSTPGTRSQGGRTWCTRGLHDRMHTCQASRRCCTKQVRAEVGEGAAEGAEGVGVGSGRLGSSSPRSRSLGGGAPGRSCKICEGEDRGRCGRGTGWSRRRVVAREVVAVVVVARKGVGERVTREAAEEAVAEVAEVHRHTVPGCSRCEMYPVGAVSHSEPFHCMHL